MLDLSISIDHPTELPISTHTTSISISNNIHQTDKNLKTRVKWLACILPTTESNLWTAVGVEIYKLGIIAHKTA